VTALPLAFREALAMHQMLRRLGFRADDIYVVRGRDGDVFVQLRAQELKWHAYCGVVPSPDTFEADWRAAADWWNEGGPNREALYAASAIARAQVPLVVALMRHGFSLARNLS
jgi:hypothetical protein